VNATIQVLRRVGLADYELPSDVVVSDSCKDLLMRILVVDPTQRITIAQIQQHPWCVLPLLTMWMGLRTRTAPEPSATGMIIQTSLAEDKLLTPLSVNPLCFTSQ
jgi:serine/threonine protein kinase